MEEEFPYVYTDDRCYLWFFENHLPGYAWYVPKANGYINIGIGGNVAKLRAKGSTIKMHWCRLVKKLDKSGLTSGYSFKPNGYSYYLHQKTVEVRKDNVLIVSDAVGLAILDLGEGIRTAIESGLLAADAIMHDTDYSIASIPKYSLFLLLSSRLRNII